MTSGIGRVRAFVRSNACQNALRLVVACCLAFAAYSGCRFVLSPQPLPGERKCVEHNEAPLWVYGGTLFCIQDGGTVVYR